MSRIRIGDVLKSRGIITSAQLDEALAIQKKTRERLGTILVRAGMLRDEELLGAVSELLETPIWDLELNPPTREALALIPMDICKACNLVPVEVAGPLLRVAMLDVDDVEAIDLIGQHSKKIVKPNIVSESQLARYLASVDGEIEKSNSLVSQALEVVGDDRRHKFEDAVLTEEATTPVVGLVNQIIGEAISMHASDIHLEPRANRVDVRFRLDGLLHVVKTFPARLLPMVVARIKIMADLDIVESRMPQDGRFTARLEGRNVDIRVSILPNRHGQRVVLRVLDGSVATRRLEELGFAPENSDRFHDMIATPYGLILVTGPTGSGKTTTLYAAINELLDTSRNIMTCEDPIEYDLDGVNQSQINERVGLTFSAQLRAMLRQDPDIVLVGEIRDSETLETAMRASMTGHLVLSTLHCNDAIAALPRLFDMGAEPYLLSTSLLGVTAQRLVRRLCLNCRSEEKPTEQERELFREHLGKEPATVFRPVGCDACLNVGFQGRMGIHEVVAITPELSSAIAMRAPVKDLAAISREAGHQTIQWDVLNKVYDGHTSVDEARRLLAFVNRHGDRNSAIMQLAS